MILTDRDLKILNLIGRGLGFALTSHIARLFFPHQKVASRRLSILTEEGYLCRIERPSMKKGRTEFAFCVSPKGIAALKTPDEKNVGIPSLKEISHTILINDFIVDLHCAASRNGFGFEFVKDSFLREENRLEQFIQSKKEPLKVMYPDIVFCLTNKEGKKGLFLVEVERTTIPLQSFKTTSIKEKVFTMASYLDNECFVFFNDLFKADFQGFRYLIITSGTETRINNIISSCMLPEQDIGFVWLATCESISEQTVFERIWRKLDSNDTSLYALIKTNDKGGTL